jgi:hypothetical protein
MKPLVLVVLLLLILVLLSLPFALWLLTPRPNLAVTVYDKSVATAKAEQHQNLGWFLSHNKFPTEEGKPFRTQSTYLGYHPREDNPIRDLSTLDEKTDLLYIADTYGVYKSGEGFSRTLAEGESNLIWGGSSASDVQAIKAFRIRGALCCSGITSAERPNMSETSRIIRMECFIQRRPSNRQRRRIGRRRSGWEPC